MRYMPIQAGQTEIEGKSMGIKYKMINGLDTGQRMHGEMKGKNYGTYVIPVQRGLNKSDTMAGRLWWRAFCFPATEARDLFPQDIFLFGFNAPFCHAGNFRLFTTVTLVG